jgi:hypothetical protein
MKVIYVLFLFPCSDEFHYLYNSRGIITVLNEWRMGWVRNFWWGNILECSHLVDQGGGCMIILNWMFDKWICEVVLWNWSDMSPGVCGLETTVIGCSKNYPYAKVEDHWKGGVCIVRTKIRQVAVLLHNVHMPETKLTIRQKENAE